MTHVRVYLLRRPIGLRTKPTPAEPENSATTSTKTQSVTPCPEDILADVIHKGYKIQTSRGAVAKSPPKVFKKRIQAGSPKGRLTQRLECHLHTVEVTGSNPVSLISRFREPADFMGFALFSGVSANS